MGGFIMRPIYFPVSYTACDAGLASARSNQPCMTHLNKVDLKVERDLLP